MSPVARALVAYAVAVVAVVLASSAAGLLLLQWYPAALAEHAIASLPGLLVGGLASSSALLLVAVLAARRPRRATLALVRPRAPALALLTMVIGTLALGQALESLAHVVGLGAQGTPEVIRRSIVAASPRQLVLAVLTIGALAGFAEELFFRGYMHSQLRLAWPPPRAVVLTGACFGALHLDWIHAALAFALGIYLGFVRERSGSTLAAALCHGVNNGVSVILTALVGGSSPPPIHGMLLVAATLVFLLSVRALRPGASCPPPDPLAPRQC